MLNRNVRGKGSTWRTLALATLLTAFIALGLRAVAQADEINVPTPDHPDLASALAEASPGDVIVLAAGEYLLSDAVEIDGAEVTIRGAAAPPGAAATTLRADGDRVLVINAAGVTIEGVAITGGATNQGGGGLVVSAGASLTLRNSTVAQNSAREGGGILNDGTLQVVASTIANNEAARGKGGGILNNGTLTIVNSTIVGNSASQGGGLSTGGAAQLDHVTITGNSSTNKPGGGADRNGGTLVIRHSIIANNTANEAAGRDCSGTPDLLDGNLVSVLQGCNPVGPVIVADPLLQPLSANGGPTETMALGDGSQAIDAIPAASCSLTVDQRGAGRPSGAGCDLGAWEKSPLALTLALTAEPATVGVGVRSVPAEAAFQALVEGSGGTGGSEGPDTAGLHSIGLHSIGLHSITIEDLGLHSIGLHSIGLHSIGLHSIGLHSIGLHSIGLHSIGLHSIGLHSILLSDVPLLLDGGWEAYLAGTQYEGLPVQSLTLQDVLDLGAEPEVTLADLDLSETGLHSIGLHSILLADAGLHSIPLTPELVGATDAERRDSWCALLGPDVCAILEGEDGSEFSLLSLDLLDAEKPAVPVADIPLEGLSVAALNPLGLHSIGLHSIGLHSIAIRNTGLHSIGLHSIDPGALATLVDCSNANIDCSPSSTDTLGDAEAAGAIWSECVMSGNEPSSTPIRGCIGNLLGLEDLLDGYTLGDLLLAFLTPDDIPWETLDLNAALLQNIADPQEPVFRYTATITVTGEPAAALAITIDLPDGFAYAANLPLEPDDPRCSPSPCDATLQEPPATFDGSAVEESGGGLNDLRFELTNVSSGVHTLVVAVRAGIKLGEHTASASAEATAGDRQTDAGPATANATVVEAFEGEAPGTITPIGIAGSEGHLQLAHISSSDDVDLYRFTVPNDQSVRGSYAKVLLSNLPADYDLTVYAPVFESVRGAPEGTLTVVDDYIVDLDPSADSFAADVVEDIPADPPSGTAVRAVSSRRGTPDEEVNTGTLIPGATYYVQVSSYNASLSDEPYALRVKVFDGPAVLDTCSAPARYQGLAPDASAPVLPEGTNTLFLTNLAWLGAALGGDGAGAVTAAINEINSVSAETGIVGAFLPVDHDGAVWAAYQNWDANRCSPDARNAVVRTIGALLDGILAANPGIEYLVIVGDDGVVPMAALPDPTAISNERTFAQEFDGNNELVSTLANGMFLSDDPYGAPRGIRVRDRELYVPTLSTGRLVETTDEIVTALSNFVRYRGQLDPATAAVSGYDFLADGAHEVAAALGDAGLSVDTSLINDTWTREQLTAALQAGPGIFSPNAHYDWEDLLPADQDALGTFDDLFSVSDLAALREDSQEPPLNPILNPAAGAIVFTMGCHAGLSVSDIQLGLAATDWAQTYLGLGNLFIGHTTFGYGDSDLVALSERLTSLFATQLGSTTAGQALLRAKQQYLATTPVLNPYDEKVLQSLTFYGLPMFRTGPAPVEPAQSAGAGAEVVGNADVTFLPGGRLEFQLTVGPSSGPGILHEVQTDEGSYYEVDGQTFAAQHRPVQPRVDIPLEGTATGGFLITSLVSQEIVGFDPLHFRPTVDLAENEPRVTPGDASFPARLSQVTDYQTPGGPRQNLVVIPGQYQSGDGTSPGSQRLFTSVAGELIPRGGGPADDSPARIISSAGRIGDGVATFEIRTDATATRVYVLFKEGGTTAAPQTWRGVELVRTPDTNTWVGGDLLQSGGPAVSVEFIVQAVGDGGSVSMSNNKAEDFLAAEPFETGDIEFQVSGPSVAGYYTGDVQVTVSSAAGGVMYSLDAGPFQPYTGPVVVGGSGGHTVLATDAAGSVQFVFFVIDESPPVLAASLDPDSQSEWAPAGVSVTIGAVDVGQSGVESITWQASGAQPSPPVTEPGDRVGLVLNAEGETTITATAVDHAGNVSGPFVLVVKVDSSAPAVSCPPAPEQWFATEPSVDCTVSDAGSGVPSPTVTLQVQPVSTGTEVTNASTNSVEVCDVAGNCTTAGPVSGFKVDRKGPTVTVTSPLEGAVFQPGQAVALAYSCSDAGSGAATPCGTPASGTPLDTASPGSKSVTVAGQDAVGNTTTVVVRYTVAYRVCLDYDPASPTNAGAVVPIKLRLCDSAGNNLSSSQVRLLAVSVDDSLTPGPNDAGSANARFEFRFRGGGYIYNMDTDFLAAGPHTLDFIVLDATNQACANLPPGSDPGEVGACTFLYRAPFTLR